MGRTQKGRSGKTAAATTHGPGQQQQQRIQLPQLEDLALAAVALANATEMSDALVLPLAEKKAFPKLSIKDKITIIQRLMDPQAKYTQADAAREFQRTPGGISKLWKKYGTETGLRKLVAAASANPEAQTTKEPEFREVDEKVYKWWDFMVTVKRQAVTAVQIRNQAKVIAESVLGPNHTFAASNGWYEGWCRRYGINTFNSSFQVNQDGVVGIPHAPRESTAMKMNEIRSNSQTYDVDTIYNMAESNLFWRMLPRYVFFCVCF